jgi:DNA-binding NtrC family response regulator
VRSPEDFNLLIVDDEPALRESIAINLKMNDYSIFQSSSGQEAIKITESHRIDFVLTDIQMANGDGVELLKNIRGRNPEVPIILMMTGFAKITKDEAIELGALDILEKPLNFQRLEEYIETVRLGLD